MSTSHQPLIDALNKVKESIGVLPGLADEHTKNLMAKLSPKDRDNYSEIVDEMKGHIKSSEDLDINKIVQGVKDKVNELNKARNK